MERLTRRETVIVRGNEFACCNYKKEDCNDYCMYETCKWQEKANMRLKHYEDLEESLEKSYGECDGLLETVVNHLAEHPECKMERTEKSVLLTDQDAEKWKMWKAAEEEGKMLILPCKHGDIVYLALNVNYTKSVAIKEPVMARIVSICSMRSESGEFIWCMKLFCEYGDIIMPFDRVGKTVFLTEQEAKKALEVFKNERL